jgi:hypothetical protein
MSQQVEVPTGQVDRMVAPIEVNTRYVDAGNLRFGVEFREMNARVINENYGHDPQAMKFFEKMMDIDDVGISIHVFSRADMIERLRFDAFDFLGAAHYHYVFPDGSHKKMDYDAAACGAMLPWALRCMDERLPEMLQHAGAADVAEELDPAAYRAAIPEIAAVAQDLVERTR